MIEDLEADLTRAPIYASNTDNADLAKVANADEAITAVSKAGNEMEFDRK